MLSQLSWKPQGYMELEKNSEKHKCRIGQKPYFLRSQKESLDLDTKEDFKILKTYL